MAPPFVGAVSAFYVAFQTIGWQQWPLPPLNMAINLVFTAILLLIAWRLRMRFVLLPLLFGLTPAILKYVPLIIRLLKSLIDFQIINVTALSVVGVFKYGLLPLAL